MVREIFNNAVAKASFTLGEATLLECAAALALGESITKASDLSGRQGAPKALQFVIRKVVSAMKTLSKKE